MKKVLVTGGSGFVGRHVLPSLVKEGYEVHATTSRDNPIALEGVVWHRVDLLNPANAEPLLSTLRPSHLLHLAWCVEHGKYWTSLENFQWVQASLSLMKAFSAHGGERAVFAGTCAEYDWGFGVLSEGTTPCVSKSPYSACKNALYSMLSSYAEATGTSFAWGRLFFIFGPHEHPARLVPSVIRGLLQDQTVECSEGRQLRDFLFIEDAARAFTALLGSRVAGAVNIASGQAVSVRNLVERISSQLGKKDRVRFGARPAAENEPSELIADIHRLTEEVGWRPQYDLDASLNLSIQWWQSVLSGELK